MTTKIVYSLDQKRRRKNFEMKFIKHVRSMNSKNNKLSGKKIIFIEITNANLRTAQCIHNLGV